MTKRIFTAEQDGFVGAYYGGPATSRKAVILMLGDSSTDRMARCGAADRYLYAVQILKDRYLCVRSVDLAHYLGITKASVSAFIRQMREQGLIETEPDGNLLLTDAGQQRAKLLGVRIEFFRRLLTDAGVQPELALRDAVSFSWKMSEASFDAFRAMKAEQQPCRNHAGDISSC